MKYENRLITFIDILGFKEIVRSSEKDDSKIEFLYSVLDYLKSWETSESWSSQLVEIEEDAQKKGVENFDIRNKTNSTSFSDSIVVSVKVDNNVNEMASTLIVNLAYIGAILFEKGILFRDITTLIKNEKAFEETVNQIIERSKKYKVDKIAAIESRGFVFASAATRICL